jgi:predicted RNA-binding Zn ribbon-like protein
VNTEVISHGAPLDRLGVAGDLLRWAAAAGVVDDAAVRRLPAGWSAGREAAGLLRDAKALRMVVRAALTALAAGKALPAETLPALNHALASGPSRLRIEARGRGYATVREPLDPTPAAILAPIAESAAWLLEHGDAALVRRCENPACIRFFYDTTKNRRRRWCSMDGCGSRAKAAAYYRRRKATGAALVAAIAMLGSALAGQGADRATVAERVRTLTRASAWTEVARIAMRFPAFHPQGMVRIGDALYVSSVEITTPTTRFPAPRDGYDRDPGRGVGHLFKVDLRRGHEGTLLASATLGEGTMYHPGGIDFDGTSLWVPVAEYRPDSRTLIYTVDPQTLKATVVLRVADHIGGVVPDREGGALHGVSWGSRRFYRWPMRGDGTFDGAAAASAAPRANPSHYVDYQDCHLAGRGALLCGGVAELSGPANGPPVRLGGLELVDLADGRPLHQVPVPLWTAGGHVMTRNPVWVEAHAAGLRAYFMPDDDASVLYVYDVR